MYFAHEWIRICKGSERGSYKHMMSTYVDDDWRVLLHYSEPIPRSGGPQGPPQGCSPGRGSQHLRASLAIGKPHDEHWTLGSHFLISGFSFSKCSEKLLNFRSVLLKYSMIPARLFLGFWNLSNFSYTPVLSLLSFSCHDLSVVISAASYCTVVPRVTPACIARFADITDLYVLVLRIPFSLFRLFLYCIICYPLSSFLVFLIFLASHYFAYYIPSCVISYIFCNSFPMVSNSLCNFLLADLPILFRTLFLFVFVLF
jgi:hypothetical protein